MVFFLYSVLFLAKFPLVIFPRGQVILVCESVRGTVEEEPAAEPLPSEMQLLGERLVNVKSTRRISYLGV